MTNLPARADVPSPANELTVSPLEAGLPQLHVEDLASAAAYARASKSDATCRAYASDFALFATWCDAKGVATMPASIDAVAAYLAALADSGLKASTITRRAAAISYAHRLRGAPPPTQADPVKAVLSGIRRRIGTKVERKAPLVARALRGMLKRIPDTMTGKRDRALLTLGFAAALRRSELVDLNVNDVERTDRGLVLQIRRSKTDQEGQGQAVAVPTGRILKPAAALDDWLAASGITEGAIFRPISKSGVVAQTRLTDHSAAAIVKKHVAAAGLDPSLFSGHSLRAGFVTTALEHGADALKITGVTRHKSVDTLKIYDRREAFRDHAGKDFL